MTVSIFKGSPQRARADPNFNSNKSNKKINLIGV